MTLRRARPDRCSAPTRGRECRQTAVAPPRFTVRLHNFEGPFDLLLQLIGKHELDITEMALHTRHRRLHRPPRGARRRRGPRRDHRVPGRRGHAARPEGRPAAARRRGGGRRGPRLLEARDLLFARLLQYRAYKQVAGAVRRAGGGRGAPVPALGGAGGAVRGAAAGGAARRRPGGVRRARGRGVPAQAAADGRRRPPARRRRCRWPSTRRSCASGSPSWARPRSPRSPPTASAPLEVVARFLAVLELFRERRVDLEQPEPFGELTVRWTAATAVPPADE